MCYYYCFPCLVRRARLHPHFMLKVSPNFIVINIPRLFWHFGPIYQSGAIDLWSWLWCCGRSILVIPASGSHFPDAVAIAPFSMSTWYPYWSNSWATTHVLVEIMPSWPLQRRHCSFVIQASWNCLCQVIVIIHSSSSDSRHTIGMPFVSSSNSPRYAFVNIDRTKTVEKNFTLHCNGSA